VNDLISDVLFLFQRFNWLSVIDILLVTLIFFGVIYLVRDTQAMVLLRGIILLLVIIAIMSSLADLPAFSWLVRNVFPGLLFAIPVIFAPEIRRALERIGRAGTFFRTAGKDEAELMKPAISAISTAAARLSARQHGALIVIERYDRLTEYLRTGVSMQATITAELLMQVFYPNTPLHDGAVVISGNKVISAACVMPLSSSGILAHTPERKIGLRHRAALGISEASDAIAVVVSEETGDISVAHAGRMIRHLDSDKLENVLTAFFTPSRQLKDGFVRRHFPYLFSRHDE
jgi:diadenylate cyclase